MDEVVDDLIDSLCDEYEEQRLAGHHPEIDTFLARVPENVQSHLFRWLMRLEKQWCKSANDSIDQTVESFGSKYPQYSDVIEDVFRSSEPSHPFPDVKGYQIHSFINQGGQGAVYEAVQSRTGQRVAIKLVEVPLADRGAANGGKAIEFLQNEIRVLSALQHPNVVKIFDAGECSQGFFFVMQLVEGGSLADRIQSISQMEAADYIRQIAGAVEAASKLGILHLDIKPSNILFDENSNQPLLTDFGLSQFIVGNQEETKAIGGTPDYMAPEQWERDPVDSRTDIYGLGATLYTLINGVTPNARSKPDVGGDQGASSVNRPKRANVRLSEICNRCLKPEPADRYQDLSELISDLERFAVREDARRVVQMGNRSITTSGLYILLNIFPTLSLCFEWLTNPILELVTWFAVFSMYGVVFFVLSSAMARKPNAQETVTLESLYTLWTAKMLAALTIVVALRIFLGRLELMGQGDQIHPARLTLLIAYPMFSALTGTILAAMAPRFWRRLYFVSVFWWLYSVVIIWVGTTPFFYLVPVLYGAAGGFSSLLWGLQLRKFARENSAPADLITVARTLTYDSR